MHTLGKFARVTALAAAGLLAGIGTGQAQDKGPIKIGFLPPITGPLASPGAAEVHSPRMPEVRLEVTDALGRRVVPVAKAPFEIGRRETNDLRLAGSEVSRDHAEIILEANGTYVLKDRASRYGTYVNGDQVTQHSLVHGDRIRLGRSGGAEMVFLVRDSEPAAEKSLATSDDMARSGLPRRSSSQPFRR